MTSVVTSVAAARLLPVVSSTLGRFTLEAAPPAAVGVATGLYRSGATYEMVGSVSSSWSGTGTSPSTVGHESDSCESMGCVGCYGVARRVARTVSVRVVISVSGSGSLIVGMVVPVTVSMMMVHGISAFTTCDC